MKILFILSVAFLATAQANFFTDLGHSLSTVFSTIGHAVQHELDTTGVSLLNAGLTAGKTLISQGVQALALNTANALQHKDETTTARRDISILKQIESALHNMMDVLGGVLKKSLSNLSSGLQSVAQKLSNFAIAPEEVISEVDKLVGTHNVIADAFLKTIESKAESIITSLIPRTKRNGFTDFFSGIGQSLSNVFQPVVDNVKTLATNAGTLIKAGSSALLSAAKDNVAALGQKLQPHLQALGTQLGTLVQHGSNALSALKAAGSDILQQSLQSAKEPLNNIAGTLTNAGQTIAGHVAGTLLGSLPGTTDAPST